jgi:glycosyltransferase involved in cell wall biosynthesis
MPKVTAVVPNYNHGRFLRARLDSVLAQTYRDFEVVFLDDASTDDSLRVFDDYRANPRLRTFFNDVNSGCVFKHWNKGVREARGDYVWFAESDDVAHPRFLETLVPLLDRNPQVGLAFANSHVIDARGRILGGLDSATRPLHPTRWDADYINDGREECRWYLAQINTIPNASAVLFRKELYERVGPANDGMMLMGDWEMWVKLLLVSDVAYVAEPLNHFRRAHPASVRLRSRKHAGQLLEYLQIVQLVLPLGLPPEVKEAVLEACTRLWQEQLIHANGITDSRFHLRVLQRARDLDNDLMLAIVAAIAAHAARTEAASRRPLWTLLRQLLLPVGGRRHLFLKRLLHKLLGRRAKAA